jgi:threonine dehydrogenase-like Zn-dependent dehydrogenase
MRGTILYGPRDVRFEECDVPRLIKPTDAIIRISATCVCGSDLWPYRGISPVSEPTPMGHEYCGIVEETGSEVRTIKPGQFVIGSFFVSDNTCPHCRAGYQSSCEHRESVGGAQAPLLRLPFADGTLVTTPNVPSDDLIPSLLALSDVMGTGWFAAVAANVKPGKPVAVVGDGAVGLLGVLSAKQMGAERIIAMSRHESRQKLAREFGATDIVTERGDEGVARIKELTNGIGADSVLECVGTQESMMQAIRSTRPGRVRGLRRRPARGRAQRRGVVLLACPPPWWPRPGAPLPARANRPGVEGEDQPRQGVRPDLASRPGGGGLPRDGRAPRD